jgi:hypothetical protein
MMDLPAVAVVGCVVTVVTVACLASWVEAQHRRTESELRNLRTEVWRLRTALTPVPRSLPVALEPPRTWGGNGLSQWHERPTA